MIIGKKAPSYLGAGFDEKFKLFLKKGSILFL